MQATLPGAVVTAASSNHLREVLGFVSTAQQHTPHRWPIYVYRLGNEDLISHFHNLCRVRYRRLPTLPAGSYTGISPYDARYLTNSAWKPIVILECLQRLPPGGLLLYGDASTRLVRPLDEDQLLLQHLASTGVLGRRTTGDVAHYTHPSTVKALKGPPERWRRTLASRSSAAASHSGRTCRQSLSKLCNHGRLVRCTSSASNLWVHLASKYQAAIRLAIRASRV